MMRKPQLWWQWHPREWIVAFELSFGWWYIPQLFFHVGLGPVGVSFKLLFR